MKQNNNTGEECGERKKAQDKLYSIKCETNDER